MIIEHGDNCQSVSVQLCVQQLTLVVFAEDAPVLLQRRMKGVRGIVYDAK